jgi:MFS family permease
MMRGVWITVLFVLFLLFAFGAVVFVPMREARGAEQPDYDATPWEEVSRFDVVSSNEMHPRRILFIGNFFFSLCAALIFYILLPYLSSFMPTAYAGLVVALGGLTAVIFFPLLPRLVAPYSAQWLALLFATVETVVLFILATAPGAVASVLLLIIIIAIQPFIAYELDLLLEAIPTENNSVGRVRTLFITAGIAGSLIAPLLLGLVLNNSEAYGRILIAGAAMLLPLVFLLAARRLPKGRPPHPSHLWNTVTRMMHDGDLAAVTVAHLVLYIFFVLVPLYIPIYLHTELGIPWSSLGWMFSLTLLPYVFIEYPAGWLADTFLGDRELMLLGFLIAGGALASVSLLSPSSSLLVILLILIGSRVGAALIESMTEAHFFRRVSRRDISSMSVFRGVWPLAYVIAPVIGSIILFFGNYQILFVLTGACIVVAGTLTTLLIRDFR